MSVQLQAHIVQCDCLLLVFHSISAHVWTTTCSIPRRCCESSLESFLKGIALFHLPHCVLVPASHEMVCRPLVKLLFSQRGVNTEGFCPSFPSLWRDHCAIAVSLDNGSLSATKPTVTIGIFPINFNENKNEGTEKKKVRIRCLARSFACWRSIAVDWAALCCHTVTNHRESEQKCRLQAIVSNKYSGIFSRCFTSNYLSC